MRLLLSALASVLAFAPSAFAQTPPTAPLVIEGAVPDDATGTLTISGNGFGTRPFVTLDLVPLNLQLSLQQRIIAVVPVDQIAPGSYVLTVTRGAQPGDTASADVQIGPAVAAPPQDGLGRASNQNATNTGGSSSTAAALAGGTDAAARVGDRTFTTADVDREWQRIDPTGYLAASRQLYDARRRVVTDMVNNELLAREATARGMSVDALLKVELPKRTVALPDNAVTALYQSLGGRTRGASLEQMRPALREWLARKVEPDLAKMTYLEDRKSVV